VKFAILVIAFIVISSCIVFPAAAEVYYSASTPQIITKGDTFAVSGIGATNGTIAVWIIGREYFDFRTATPDRNGNFSLMYKPTDTMKFENGQYAVVLQDPGKSRSFEIEPGKDNGGNLTFMNRGKIIYRLGKVQDLPGNVQKETDALTSSAHLEEVDDTFLVRYFSVEKPAINFDGIIPASNSRLADMVSGEKITISGTTNLRNDDFILASIIKENTGTQVTEKDLSIIPGSSLNTWTYVLDEPGLEPGDYRIMLSCAAANITGTDTAHFSVKGKVGETPPYPHLVPAPPGGTSLPEWLDTLLILGILFVGAVVVYTLTKN
jgi:hypothetical protein